MATEQDTSNSQAENSADKPFIDLTVSQIPEAGEKPLKYPKQVFFIIGNEFCERFCYYGNRTILAIYLTQKLRYSEDDATEIYHAFVMICYFFPVLGALIADCYLGKFKTILYLSIIYAIGNIVLAFSSQMSFAINHTAFSLLGLFLIALGTGGIKPCVSSFGGDQFVVPQQEKQLTSFFSVFYFSINAGSLISTYLTPDLRVLKCFGEDSCYPIAFGVPALLMVISLIFFICGKPLYKITKPKGNIMVDVAKVIGRAVYRKIASKDKKDHWLDYASDKYDQQLVDDTKILMELIYLFSPTIVFWALYEQQGTRWTFQAVHMNGKFGSFTLMPDQMQVINPILIMAFIPLFEVVVYPFLAKIRFIRTSLQKLFWGGVVAALAFAISAVVEYQVQDAYAILPAANEAQLRIYNSYNCSLQIDAVNDGNTYSWSVDSLGLMEKTISSVSKNKSFTYSARFSNTSCPNLAATTNETLTVYEAKAVSYIVVSTNASSLNIARIDSGFDDLDKSDNAQPKVRIIYRVSDSSTFKLSSGDGSTVADTLSNDSYATDVYTVSSDSGYSLAVGNVTVASKLNLDVGGVYTLLLAQNVDTEVKLFTLTPPNTVNILWQVPQIVIISVAEIMFSITGLEFSYSQAPKSMKSVISSVWLLTDSFGNLIIILVSAATENIAQVYLLLGFAVGMLLIMFVFILLARRFTRAMKNLSTKQ